MANDTTFGHMLLNDALPDDLSLSGPVTKKDLKKAMSAYARRDPEGYVKTIQKVKRVGDEVSTWEGLSVGLDDIEPDYKRRDPIIKNALKDVKAAKTDAQRRKVLLRTQDQVLKATENHPSDMTMMAKSGGRGSIAQLMKTVSSPVVATTSNGEVTPWLVTKSYAQGLNPADAWVTGVESRRNAIASTGSVVEPGAVAKVVVTNMEDLVVTKNDCGTMNGIMLSIDDQVVDRYLARGEGSFPRNTLVTPSVLNDLKKARVKKVLVRSPATCAARDGVCQKCMGLDEWGKDHRVGTNVGVRSAQALTEPLTQFALNAKHGVRLAGKNKELRGLKGFRVLTEVPKSFTEKAAIAKKDGKVDTITRAPQGGWYITVSGKRYYSPPKLQPIVKEGDRVEAGDALTEGTPMPDEVVKYKGIGEGRRYLADSITGLYRRQGVDLDRRHPELLARKAMNHVRVKDDPSGEFIPGDIVEYTALEKAVAKNTTRVPLGNAKNKTLAAPILHYSVGTRLTPSVIDQLRSEGVKEVEISKNGPKFEPIMKSIIQTPLLNDDWMSRLSHRYLRRTLVDGAGFGYESDISSTSPVPAYVLGAPFGTGTEGKYASVDDYVLSTAEDRGEQGDEDLMRRFDVHQGGTNVAYSSLRPVSTEGDGPWISGIWVHPDHRGKGLAKTLMQRIEEAYPGQTLRLRARPYKDKAVDTETLMKIYEGMGFESYDEDTPSRMMKKAPQKTASELQQFLVDTLTAPINRPSRTLTHKTLEPEPTEPTDGSVPEPDVDNIEDQVLAVLESMAPPEPPAAQKQTEPPPPQIPESDDAAKTASVRSRLARGAKKFLFGTSGKGTRKLTKAIDDDTLKLIAPSGGIESRAIDLKRMQKAMPDLDSEAAGLTRQGVITEEGRHFVDEMQNMRGGMLDGAHRQAPRAAQKWEKVPVLGGLFQRGEYSADELENIREGLSQHITPEMFDQYQSSQTGGRRFLRGARNIFLGESPLEITRQRYRTGGLLGKGGLIRSDFAIDPDTVRAWRNYRRTGELSPLLTSGAMEALNKYMSIYLPGRALYEATTAPVGEGESRAENVGGSLGEVAGWAVGGPFGLLGGNMIASPTIAGGKALGRKLDPNYTPPPQQQQQAAPVWQRVQNTYTQGIQAHPAMNYYQGLNRAQNAAQQRWSAYQRQRAQQGQ